MVGDNQVDIVMPQIKWDGLSPFAVTKRSPLSHRRAVFRFAQYFRREMGYDFVQYGLDGEEDDPHCTAYLWQSMSARYGIEAPCYGAACFREREEGGPALQWVWIHPYLRRKGLLSDAWNMFEERHPRFAVELPLSPAMLAFLEKRGCAGGFKGWYQEYFREYYEEAVNGRFRQTYDAT